VAGKPSPPPNYHLAPINQPPKRAIRSPGVLGTGASFLAPPEMRLGKRGVSAKRCERVIAFYEPDNGRCAVNAVVYDKTDAYTGMTTAARVRVSLNPRQMVHIDSTIMRRSTSSAETMPKR
jgi:hypothetical protein